MCLVRSRLVEKKKRNSVLVTVLEERKQIRKKRWKIHFLPLDLPDRVCCLALTGFWNSTSANSPCKAFSWKLADQLCISAFPPNILSPQQVFSRKLASHPFLLIFDLLNFSTSWLYLDSSCCCKCFSSGRQMEHLSRDGQKVWLWSSKFKLRFKICDLKCEQFDPEQWFKLSKEKSELKNWFCNPSLRLFHVDIQPPGLRPFEETIIQF